MNAGVLSWAAHFDAEAVDGEEELDESGSFLDVSAVECCVVERPPELGG